MILLICLLSIATARARHPESTLDELSCGHDYKLFNGLCYRLYESPLSTYEEARIICKEDEADLVSIHNMFENIYVEDLNTDELLIGLQYSTDEKIYKWSDGTPLDFTNYADHFVDYNDYFGYCAKSVKGKWTNAQCEVDKLKFVCKKTGDNVTITENYVCPDPTAMYFTSGVILSPGYPLEFDFNEEVQNKGCYYQLVGKNLYFTKLIFDEVAIKESGGAIAIYDGWDATEAKEVIRVDSDFTGIEIVVDYNRVLLHLENAAHGRYKIKWETFAGPENATAINECPAVSGIYTQPDTIYSPGYPNYFELPTGDAFAGCPYRLITTEGYYIKLAFEEIRFEGNQGRIDVFLGWKPLQQNRAASLTSNDQGKAVLVAADKVLLLITNATRASYKIKWSRQACLDNWSYYNGSCYTWGGSCDHWPDRQSFCVSIDSNLTSITSQAENDFVFSVAKNFDTWIGLIKTDKWQWIDGTPYTYSNWASGQPSDASYNRVVMRENTYWYAGADNWIAFPLCEQYINKRKKQY